MTEEERKELAEQMARRIDAFVKDTSDWRKVLAVEIARNLCIDKKDFDTLEWGAKEYFLTQARAALAVAEPVIREQCARIAEGELLHFPKLTKAGKGYNQACNEVAAAIREGGKDERYYRKAS